MALTPQFHGTPRLSPGKLSAIDKPVDQAHHDGTADHISQRHRKKIDKKEIVPGEIRIVRKGFPHEGPEIRRPPVFDGKAGRDEIHVRDAVLKPGRDEGRDRRDD